ncbi:MAG: ribonuclease P protein component [Actinomycetota bacterium]
MRGCRPSGGEGATRGSGIPRVLAEGAPLRGARVVVFVAPGSGRVGFVAGRRVGGAVFRNRARRILRAAWRELAPRIRQGYDVALVARGGIRGANTQDLVGEVGGLLSRARVIVK